MKALQVLSVLFLCGVIGFAVAKSVQLECKTACQCQGSVGCTCFAVTDGECRCSDCNCGSVNCKCKK